MQRFGKRCYGWRALRLLAVIALCAIISSFPVWANATSPTPATSVGGTNALKLETSDVAHAMDEAAKYVAFTVLSTIQPGPGIGFWSATSEPNADTKPAGIATAHTEPAEAPQPADQQEAKNEVRYPIEITSSAWQHIMDRHTPGGPENAGKSIFNQGVDIRALIENAELATPVLESNGYYSRELDAGRNIGCDGQSSKQTSIYRVITTQSGKLVTAYPVMP